MWAKIVVKIVKTVAVLLDRDKNFRELFLFIIGALLLPVFLAVFLICVIGSSEAKFNFTKVKSVVGESGSMPSGLGAQADSFYTSNDKEFKEMMKVWNKKKKSAGFKDNDEWYMRVFLKATYYVASAEGKIPEKKKDREAFVKVFLGRKQATDVFSELADLGISLNDDQKGRIYQIWCMIIHESYVDPQDEESGIWKGFGETVVELRMGIFKSPFLTDWTKHVTSEFGMREHPTKHTRRMHQGIDIGMSMGTEILSCSNGVVEASGYSDSMGNYVRVRATNGYTLTYMHMMERKVEKGQVVMEGEVLGLVGSTGDSTGPHLHLGIQNTSGEYINPRSVLSVPMSN